MPPNLNQQPSQSLPSQKPQTVEKHLTTDGLYAGAIGTRQQLRPGLDLFLYRQMARPKEKAPPGHRRLSRAQVSTSRKGERSLSDVL